jgi:hypothetical protein
MTTSFMTDIGLKPQTKTILNHLRKRKSISTMEAMVAYGNTRLAAAIYDLRQAGYRIRTNIKRDEGNHQYSRYELAA